MKSIATYRRSLLGLFLSVLFLGPLNVWAGEDDGASDGTMLMFVGEDAPMVTVASKSPESPGAAPAITSVMDRKEIEDRGFQTLAELLSTFPGFYMAKRARGTVPYLRGVENGPLFLYDGVPFSTDATKELYPLDRELSLHSVKAVEVVRGPASVLWGPDAFAGIVNVAPLRGRDRPGVEAKAFGGTDRLAGGYVSYGVSDAEWDSFISVYGAKDRYREDTYAVLTSGGGPGKKSVTGEGEIDDSSYFEATGNLNVGDWLNVSGRLSDFTRRYTMHDAGQMSWAGKRKSPVSYLKAAISQTYGPSHFSLTGYYENSRYELTDVDINRSQSNHIYNGELLWDRRMWERGLMTAGVSYRENQVKGAVVRGNFLPEFLKPSNKVFVPTIVQADFNTRLASAFAQYRHTWDEVNCWFGGRVDDHSQYKTTFSYSLGLNWAMDEAWRMKASYGTAYRSPYSSQLFGGKSFEPEGVSTLNLQIAWSPHPGWSMDLTGFWSRLTDQIAEDPYGGLSYPTDEDIVGAEFTGRTRVFDQLDLFTSLTALHCGGGTEHYRAFKYAYIRPDGTMAKHYDIWDQPYDAGPSFMADIGITWTPHPKATLTLEGGITGSVPFSYAENTVSGRYSQPFLLDLTFNLKDVPVKDASLMIRGTNLFNNHYQIPGLYGPVEGVPFAFYAEIAYRF